GAADASAWSASCWTPPTAWRRACARPGPRSKPSQAAMRIRSAKPCRRCCASACGCNNTATTPRWTSCARCATRSRLRASGSTGSWCRSSAPAPRCPDGARMGLVLASTSVYRRELLARLRLPFDAERPEVDEAPRPRETPSTLVARLAQAKAAAVAARHPADWVIGSDQVAELDGAPLGKPGDRDRAIAQLAAMSGRAIAFRTAVALVGPGNRRLAALDTTTVRFRDLAADEIARYVDAEQPFDCAGSFKSEGLGIALFAAIESNDPTALIGMPLIATSRLLREAGFALP